jgi:hypothetical protein
MYIQFLCIDSILALSIHSRLPNHVIGYSAIAFMRWTAYIMWLQMLVLQEDENHFVLILDI